MSQDRVKSRRRFGDLPILGRPGVGPMSARAKQGRAGHGQFQKTWSLERCHGIAVRLGSRGVIRDPAAAGGIK